MGLLDSITAWFKRESADVKDSMGKLERDLSSDLSAKERELSATPEEKMAMIQDQIDDDSSFDAIRDRIDRSQAHADATAELADAESDTDPSGQDDVSNGETD